MELASQREVVEGRKERMNMRPNLRFIEANKQQYAANVQRYLSREVSDDSNQWSMGIAILNPVMDETLQLPPDLAQALLARVPAGFQRVSLLKGVDYEWQKNVAVPQFNEEGIFSGVQLPSIEEFNGGDYHKTRVLTGYTKPDGTIIKPTHIPLEVSSDPEAIRLYQAHVLLHEFFHTVEVVLRTEENAKKLQLRPGRTFADWAQDFLESLKEEKLHTSYYSGVYHHALYDENHHLRQSVTPYDYAVRELMAEAFVAYQFDIISNPRGYTSFQSQSFGNAHPEQELLKHGGQSKRYGLMKELCDADLQLVKEAVTDKHS
jgi:hypothetical protein